MNVCALMDPKSVTPGRSNVIFIIAALLVQQAVRLGAGGSDEEQVGESLDGHLGSRG